MTFELSASLRSLYPALETFTNSYLENLEAHRACAIKFLAALAQIDENQIYGYPFCFQTIKQPDAGSLPTDVSWALASHRTGSFTFCEKWLRKTNLPEHGGFMGAYVTVNETDGRGRKSSNVTSVRALFVELDHGGLQLSHINEFVSQFLPSIVVESSPGKLHCYWLVHSESCPLQKFASVQTLLQQRFEPLRAGKEAKDLPRVLRVPGFLHLKDLNRPFVVKLHHCDSSLVYGSAEEVFAACKIDQNTITKTESSPTYKDASPWSPEVLASIDPKTGKYLGAPKDHRNTALFRWMREYLCRHSETEPVDIFHKACLTANKKNKPPLDEAEVLASAESALTWFNAKMLEREALAQSTLSEFGSDQEQDIIPSSFLPVISYNYSASGMACAISDESLAERIVQICGSKINHSNVGGFYVYNDLIWANSNGEGKQLVSKFMRDLFMAVPGEREVQLCFTTPPDNELNYKLLASFRRYVHSAICRRAAIDLLTQRIEIATTPDQFNREEESDVIACPNGILDLSLGELIPPDPKYRLTHVMGTRFDSIAECPTWDYFVSSCMGQDASLINYLQKITGYFLSGRTHLQSVFVVYGVPGTGKSVYLAVMGKLLAGYFKELHKNTLILNSGSENAKMSSLAQAVHCRLATIAETSSKDVWDESLVKQISGNDPVTAKMSHKDTIVFTPRFKVCIRANNLPAEDQYDEGLWQRLTFIPFEVRFRGTDNDNKSLIGDLAKELPGILNWAVKGYQMLLAEGLEIPDKARAQKKTAQCDAEPIRAFVERGCVKCGHTHEKALSVDAFWIAFGAFCRADGKQTNLGRNKANYILKELGVINAPAHDAEQKKSVRKFNLRLKTDAEKLEEEVECVTSDNVMDIMSKI